MTFNPFTAGIPAEQFAIWGVNVLLQTTCVCAVVLLLAVGFRRHSALRYGVLCSGLIVMLCTPVIASLMLWSGHGLFAVSMAQSAPASQQLPPVLAQHIASPPAENPNQPDTTNGQPARTPVASQQSTPPDKAATAGSSSVSSEERHAGPVAAGLLRPRVVLPANLVGRMNDEEARLVLLHEMAHILRRDQIIVLLQNLAAALFWLHPLASILNRQVARAREEVCDNYVLAVTDAPTYSRTLLTLARSLQSAHPLPGTVGLFTSQWSLERRVAGLLDGHRNRTTRLTRRGRCLIAALSLVTLLAASLGTVVPADDFSLDDALAFHYLAEVPDLTISGSITNSKAEPVPDAIVAVVARKVTNDESHGVVPRVLCPIAELLKLRYSNRMRFDTHPTRSIQASRAASAPGFF